MTQSATVSISQDTPQSAFTNLIQRHQVLEARDAYAKALREFSETDLATHADYLTEEISHLKKERLAKRWESYNSPSKVAKIQLSHLTTKITAFDNAYNNILDNVIQVRNTLTAEFEKVLKALDSPEHAMTQQNGDFDPAYIRRIYDRSRDDTKERYKELDTWYALGNEYAIDRDGKLDRACRLALMPIPIQHAKWRFMLALTDAAFNINFSGIQPDRLDKNNTEILTKFYTALSQHERGSDNPRMPSTHKYRHNPAIHSLHVVALIDKIFHDAEVELSGKLHNNPTLQQKMRALRQRLMKAALVHDCGEMDGELSQGILVGQMKPDEKAQFSIERNTAEEQTFLRHLDECRPLLKHIENGRYTDEPISDDEWKKLREGYIQSFELTEGLDAFEGRFVKSCERIQSQHDYLRFEGLNNGELMKNAPPEDKVFSMNYVSDVYRDAPVDSLVLGEHALRKLANETPDNDMRVIFSALSSALEPEYVHLMDKLTEAFAVPDRNPENMPSHYWRTRSSTPGPESGRAA